MGSMVPLPRIPNTHFLLFRALLAASGFLLQPASGAIMLTLPELTNQAPIPFGHLPGLAIGGMPPRVGGGDFGGDSTLVPVSIPEPAPAAKPPAKKLAGEPVKKEAGQKEKRQTPVKQANRKKGPLAHASSRSRASGTAPSPSPAIPMDNSPGPRGFSSLPYNLWEFSVRGGWNSDYFFRGQNVFERVSPDSTKMGLTTFAMDWVWNDAPGPGKITVAAAYQQSLDPLLPNGAAAVVPANNFNRFDNEQFGTTQKERYQELNFALGYTLDLMPRNPGVLGLNVGLNHYRFLDGRFWQQGAGRPEINDTTETEVKLFYLPRWGGDGDPLFKSTFGWWHDFAGFEGDFLELGLEKAFPLTWLNHSRTRGMLGVSPFANLGYAFDYNASGSGWNHLETGVRLPFQLGQNLFLNIKAAYNWNLDGPGPDARADEGFAASVGFITQLGGPLPVVAADFSGESPKGPSLRPPSDYRWSISGGAGWREWDVSFNHRPVEYYDVSRLYKSQTGGGDLRFVYGRDARYLTGAVLGSQKNTVGAAPVEGGERLGSRDLSGEVAVGNRQVRFESKRYEQTRDDRHANADGTGDDHVISPYVKLSRELGRQGNMVFDWALIYAFTDGQFDSGTRLSSVNSAFEASRNYGFIYTFDEVNSTSGNVVVNPDQYEAEYKFEEGLPGQAGSPGFKNNIGPQSTEDSFITEKVRVASFTKSSLILQMHELALPVGFTADLGTRWHVGLSVGPTLNLVNTRFDTDIYYQDLDVGVPPTAAPPPAKEPIWQDRNFPVLRLPAKNAATEIRSGPGALPDRLLLPLTSTMMTVGSSRLGAVTNGWILWVSAPLTPY